LLPKVNKNYAKTCLLARYKIALPLLWFQANKSYSDPIRKMPKIANLMKYHHLTAIIDAVS